MLMVPVVHYQTKLIFRLFIFLLNTNLLLPYKEQALSITMDNGMEFPAHKKVAQRLEAKTFFTYPYSSWEKGQIENMNKLLRQYYPKKKPITKENTQNIREIQMKINRRPRKN